MTTSLFRAQSAGFPFKQENGFRASSRISEAHFNIHETLMRGYSDTRVGHLGIENIIWVPVLYYLSSCFLKLGILQFFDFGIFVFDALFTQIFGACTVFVNSFLLMHWGPITTIAYFLYFRTQFFTKAFRWLVRKYTLAVLLHRRAWADVHECSGLQNIRVISIYKFNETICISCGPCTIKTKQNQIFIKITRIYKQNQI